MGKSTSIQTKDKSTKISDLSVAELKDLIKQTVQETLNEILDDPDAGLELRDEIKELLRTPPKKCVPIEEAAKNLGFEW